MKNILKGGLLTLALGLSCSSCSDFFEMDSEHIVYAEKDHLHNATDTIYSITGILSKVQEIGDRTILLGEARGDLMDVTTKTSANLRQVAMFNVDDDNEYNQPSDYYAIINNCNYFIARADTSIKNNRNEYLFKREFAAAKSIRAWTYLQLAINYGRVPFITEPILTKEQSEREYPMKDIKGICDYFLNEDGLEALADIGYPEYGTIKSLPSSKFFVPMELLLGDLNLWAGNYLYAAWYYYCHVGRRYYIYPTGTQSAEWMTTDWISASTTLPIIGSTAEIQDVTPYDHEVISVIPGDSVPSEGVYSQLRNIFNGTKDNDYEASLTPSQSLIDLSAAQSYCFVEKGQVTIAPNNLDFYRSGDLRLLNYWSTSSNYTNTAGNRVTKQTISKYPGDCKNDVIYRRQVVYLRFAEAMNRAGFPVYAYHILSTGVNNDVLVDSIAPYYYGDTLKLQQLSNFTFNSTKYRVRDVMHKTGEEPNTIGIHSRGCGYTEVNPNYRLPFDPMTTPMEDQMRIVEDMIMDENALELAFEGYRYYDLLRVALRREQTEPDYLYNKIQNRRGGAYTGIETDLMNKKNWFLHWKGQIGY